MIQHSMEWFSPTQSTVFTPTPSYTTEFRVPARSCQARGLDVVIQTHEVFRWQHLEVIRAQLAPLQSHGIVKQKHQAKKTKKNSEMV